MTNLALITTYFPDLPVAHELIAAQATNNWLDDDIERSADAYVCIADVHEASTPNAYRSPR